MLKFFRKNARGGFMLVFMFMIIVVFIFYFGTDRGARMSNALAVVDGTTITEAEFYNEYGKTTDMVKARYGGALTAEMLKKMDLKKMTFDNLINRQIIIAKANDLKIQVSDDELKQMITSMPALQTDGRFDAYKYKQMLRFNKMMAEEFEASQKINMSAAKIETIIREGVKVSDQEVLDLYAMQNQKMNLSFIEFSGADMKTAEPAPSELESYLKKNSNEFRIPEQVKVKYLYFSADNYAPAEVSQADISDLYSRRKDDYKNKDGKPLGLDEVKSQIIKEFKQNEGMKKAYELAKKAHDTIYQEQNFDKYAAQNNLKVYEVGFLPLDKLPQPLASVKDISQQLAGLEKNDVSKVLGTDTAYYVIRIEDKKSAYTPQLKDIEKDVRLGYLKSERERLAEQEANALIEKLQKGEPVEKLAAAKGFKIQETGLFQPGDTIPKVGTHPDAMETVLSLSPNRPYATKALKINNKQYIFKLKDLSPLDTQDFENKKEVYRKVAMNLKREEAMKLWLEGNKQAMIKDKRLKINKDPKDL